MNKKNRFNPLLILYEIGGLLKNSIFFVIFLFVIKSDSTSTFVTVGRYAFLLFFGLTIVSILLKWLTQQYQMDSFSFHLYKGLFTKSERTIPFTKIHNVQRRTTLFHRLFGLTQLTFETSMTGSDAAVKFDVISRSEADEIEKYVNQQKINQQTEVQVDADKMDSSSSNVPSAKSKTDRTIHFTPTKKDIIKASFTSLSFLVLIPLIGSLYFKINEVFAIDDKTEGLFSSIIGSWWVITILVIFLMAASIAFGLVRAFLKYGKYEISSDNERIYISKGVIDSSEFSIAKQKVQAIEITQSTMKRLFGLAEVKLISAGSVGEQSMETNSLYPFLPIKRAYQMIPEILPSYEVITMMDRLPKRSFWIRMVKPSWLWLIATAALFYFKPNFLQIEQGWWILSASLLVFIGIARILDFFNTRYVMNGAFVQFKTGSLQTSLFLSKRSKVIEVNVSSNKIQRLFGLASIETINRGKPVHHSYMNDVPIELADSFYTWYAGRVNEIDVK